MKFQKLPQSPAASEKATVDPSQATGSAGESKSDLGLTERRKMIRPLPAPQAVESDGDTDWAMFQSLSDGKTDAAK
jgi:hypothetical protein